MIARPWCGKPAEITFTCDFHEFVVGELRPGSSVMLRYDPHRILPAEEPCHFGDPERPVTAHLQFREGEQPVDVVLRSPAGVIACPDVDLTGQGSMLSAELAVPADAERLTIWFSCVSTAGSVLYDSDYGANYRFGFPGREIQDVRATVTRRPDQPSDHFEVSLIATSEVEAVGVPFLIVGDPGIRREIRLQRASEIAVHPEAVRWTASIDTPHQSIVRFKICYWINGRRLVDDNASAWYLAPAPEPDQTRPPAPALLEAAAAWS